MNILKKDERDWAWRQWREPMKQSRLTQISLNFMLGHAAVGLNGRADRIASIATKRIRETMDQADAMPSAAGQ